MSPPLLCRRVFLTGTVWLPSTTVTQSALVAAVHRVVEPASHAALGKVSYDVADPALSDAVGSFPAKIDCSRALALGLSAGALDMESIVRNYCDDFPSALAPAIRLTPPPPAGATAVDAVMDAALQRVAASTAGKKLSVVLVTGGGSGIGRAVALRLAKGGWQEEGSEVAVVLTGRRVDALEETASEIKSACGDGVHTLAWPADLTREADVDKLFDAIGVAYGRLDVLFNNAGANVGPTTVDQMSYKDWRMVVGINLDAAFHVARNAYVMMKEQSPQGGRIINNGSISAETPRPGSIAYTASKHAITGLTKSIALDGRAANIACGQIDYGNVVSAISAGMAVGMPQADGSTRPEDRMSQSDAADAVHYMCALPLSANVLQMTVMATKMPFVGRG